jgi:hypothetical protein
LSHAMSTELMTAFVAENGDTQVEVSRACWYWSGDVFRVRRHRGLPLPAEFYPARSCNDCKGTGIVLVSVCRAPSGLRCYPARSP